MELLLMADVAKCFWQFRKLTILSFIKDFVWMQNIFWNIEEKFLNEL